VIPLLVVNRVRLVVDGKPILKGVDLVVRKGEVHAVLGPNGAGKSTLACLIMGIGNLKSPTEGELIFKGELLNRKSIFERARMGITLAWQEPARFEGITVEEYLKLSSGGSEHFDPEECLRLVGLDSGYLLRFVDETLSGGERKRVELASVLAMNPELAILDEPDSGIDFASIDDIATLIKTMKSRGTTVLMITHREEIAEIADRASLMCDGRVVQTGSPKDVGLKFKNMCMRCEVKNPRLVGGGSDD
jgi:Fe-S cluster assembly ATP-binding protein